MPGYNCGECGFKNCREFAKALLAGADINACPYLSSERYVENLTKIKNELGRTVENKVIRGVIDGLEADFSLGPLFGEAVCREDLYPFDRSFQFVPGDMVRYRPLGCPITHFAKVLSYEHGLLTVHMVGPIHLISGEEVSYKDIGIALVAAFEGEVMEGLVPEVGQTVRFLPHHCMMQKVHSGVIVHSEGRMVRIESIDLKVW